MLRVYTTAENREAVEQSIKKVLGNEESMYRGTKK
jgi:hypothetical protein